MICTFSDPKSIGTGGVEKNAGVSDSFQYKTVTCTDTTVTTVPGQAQQQYQLITGPNGQNFYMSNTVSYGQYIIIALMVLGLMFLLLSGLFTIVFKRKY